MNRKALGATVVAIALGGAGCGGSKPLTQAEFVQKANAACKEMRTTGKAAFSHAKANHGATLRADLAHAGEQAVTRLKAIKPPSNLDATFQRYISAFSDEIGAMTSSASQTSAGTLRQERATHLATRLAETLQLSGC
jgi:hypothetical protein